MTSINGHFKFDAKLLIILPALAIAIGLLAVLVGPSVVALLAEDRCLDAGGMFLQEAQECVFTERKPRH